MLQKLRNLLLPFFVMAFAFFTNTTFAQSTAYANAGLENPTVTSDKDDYYPSEIAHITGTGWTLDQSVHVEFNETPDYPDRHVYDVDVDENGNWSIDYLIEERHLGVTFTVIVKGRTTGYVAQTIFTDANSAIAVSQASGTYGGTVNLSATMTQQGNNTAGCNGCVGRDNPISGKTLTFSLVVKVGGAVTTIPVGQATTNGSGVASLSNVNLTTALGALIDVDVYNSGIVASFAGDPLSNPFAASSGNARLTVIKATPSFSEIASSQTITFGHSTITVSGKIAAPTAIPAGGTVGVSVANTSGSGTISSDGSFSFTVNTASVAAAPGSPYTITYSYAASNNFNAAANNTSTTLTVNKATATLTIDPTTLNQTYDGTAQPVTVTTTPNGLSGVSVTYNGSATAPTNAGSYAVVASLTNTNYSATNATGTLIIAKAQPSFTNIRPSQTINFGTTSITLSGTIKAGTLVPSGSVTATVGGVSASGTITQTGGGAGNFSIALNPATIPASTTPYTIEYSFPADNTTSANFDDAENTSTTLTVNKATATLAFVGANATPPFTITRTYTRSAQTVLATTNPTGLNTVTITYKGTGGTAYTESTTPPVNAGTYTVTASLTNNNYDADEITATLTVNPKTTTVNGITANNKVYNGTTAATLNIGTITFPGVVSPDVVTLNSGSYTANFADDEVAYSGQTVVPMTVTVSGLSLSGADAGNYTLTQPTGLTATITRRPVTAAPVVTQGAGITTGVGKVYDGLTTATLVAPIAFAASTGENGVLAADAAKLSVSAAAANYTVSAANLTADKNVADPKTVNATGLALGGAAAKNYILTATSATTTAKIVAKPITSLTFEVANKRYNGNRTAALNFVDLGSDIVAGDVVGYNTTASTYSFTFNNKNVGNGKTVTMQDLTLTGTDRNNYSLTFPYPTTATANITLRPIRIGITASDKFYDGNTNAIVKECRYL
jgi:hypothetical protein